MKETSVSAHPTLTVDAIRASVAVITARNRKNVCTSFECDLGDVSTRKEIENVLIESYLICSERLED